MATYVTSDLHGCYDEFIELLNLIEFSDQDQLWVLGDVIDRGEDSLTILDKIMKSKNINMILGNHELLFMEYYEEARGINCTSLNNIYAESSIQRWYRNGGDITHKNMLQYDAEEVLYKYFRNIPTFKVLENDNFRDRKLILVHAGIKNLYMYSHIENVYEFLRTQTVEDLVWTRDYFYKDEVYQDYTIIHGHSPVQKILEEYEWKLDLKNEDVRILSFPGHKYMDCGCFIKEFYGKLACIRLEDNQEFYVRKL